MLLKIGEVEIWRILDMVAPFRAPEDLFPNAGPDVARIIEAAAPGSMCQDTQRLILPMQGFLLKTPSHVILVDACVGNHKTHPQIPPWHDRDDPRFMAGLVAAGVTPSDVDFVLCTHLHGDHVGWNTRLENGQWVPTFPNAKYLLPQADKGFAENLPSPMYAESVLPVVVAGQADFVGPDHALGDHVQLIPTPGHTPGHVSVQIGHGDACAIITGDALHTAAQVAHPEWHFVYDADAPLAQTSRTQLLGQAAETGCCVLGSHFRLPSIGRVKATADGFAWKTQGG